MFLKSLELRNFRNYQSIDVNFHPLNNIIVGGNAQGKSNLIEAIYFLSHLKSKRTPIVKNLILNGSENTSVCGTITDGKRDAKVKIVMEDGGRTLEVNGRRDEKRAVLGLLFKTVLFCPEDLELLKGGPALRREYLDETAVEVSPGHGEVINRYRHILKQRNAILKEWERNRARLPELLAPWNEALIEFGAKIIVKRTEVIECIKDKMGEYYGRISGLGENVEVKYLPTVEAGRTVEDTKEKIRRALKEKGEEEKRLRTTVVGPHRDGVEIKIRGMDARFCASQGEQRTLAFCLRLSQRDCIVEKAGEVPVLLLDDVLSELDKARRKKLVKCAEGRGQLFITSTERSDEGVSGEADFYHVKGGEVKIERA